MFVAVFLIYFSGPNSDSGHLQYFGQVGDFFGGMLNPILAFASFIALLYTIRFQAEELSHTREEFAKSVRAQQLLVEENKNHQKIIVTTQMTQIITERYLDKINKAQIIFETGLYFVDDGVNRPKKVVPKDFLLHLVKAHSPFRLEDSEYFIRSVADNYCAKVGIYATASFLNIYNDTIHEIAVYISDAFLCSNKIDSLSNELGIGHLTSSLNEVTNKDLGWLVGACALTKDHLKQLVLAVEHDESVEEIVQNARSFLRTCGCVFD